HNPVGFVDYHIGAVLHRKRGGHILPIYRKFADRTCRIAPHIRCRHPIAVSAQFEYRRLPCPPHSRQAADGTYPLRHCGRRRFAKREHRRLSVLAYPSRVTTGGASGALENGVQRNIVVSNCTSMAADTAHFDTHDPAESVTYTGCAAIGGKPA